MQTQPERFILSIEKAKKSLQTADHLTYMTFPLLRENKLLLKILDELYNSVINAINAILQHEYAYKRIQIYTDAKENFRTFKELAKKHNINPEQLDKITELLALREKHQKSPFEFIRKDKIVIMSDNLKTDTISLDRIKEFLLATKELIRNASLIISQT